MAGDKKTKGLEASYEELSKQIKGEIENTKKSLQFSLKIKIGLLIAVICYMCFVWYLISEFADPENLMETLLGTVATNTQYKEKWIEDLNATAEKNVDNLYNQLIESIPQIRMELEKAASEKIAAFAKNVEEEFTVTLDSYIKAKIENVNISDKDEAPEAKLNILISSLSNDFKTLTYTFSEELTDKISQDLVKLNKQLKKLQQGKDLGKREKYERNLLCIWVKLLNIQLKEAEEAK